MRRRCTFILAVAAFALAFDAAGTSQSSPHWSDATRRVVLDNGLTLLMLRRGELPIVSVQALYRFGSRNERPGLTGAAHYIEHMAFRATEEIGKRDLTNQILRWGGRWNGYTSYDQTVYGSHAPSEYLEWLLYLERQRIRHVLFAAAEVEVERTSVIAEEHQYQNSPDYTMVEHRLRRAAMVAHPYGSPIMGRLSDLEGVTPRELERLYRQHYAPNNLVLAIVGHFDPAQALALVKKHFEDLPGDGEPTAIRTVEPEQRGERRIAVRGRGSESYLSLMVHSPAARDERFATLLALDGVLAGGKGPGRGAARPGTRLHRALVEQGLATSVATEVELSEYPGVYEIRVAAPAGADLQAIEARLDEVLADVARRATHDEVTRAVRQSRADLAFAATSNRAMANLLSVYDQLDSYTLLADLPRRLDRVTAADVQAFARERLARERRSIGTFVPEATEGLETTAAAPVDEPARAKVEPLAPRPSTRPIPAPKLATPALPSPVSRTLPNGLRVLALPIPGEAVHLRVRIAAGAVHDPPGHEGTALLTARALTMAKAGGRDPIAELADRQIRVTQTTEQDDDRFANREFVEIGVTMFADAVGHAATALSDAITKPALDDAALARAKRALAAGTEGRQDDSRWRANRAVFEALYGMDHPYGRPPEGSRESLAAISLEDLAAFHRAHYRPENTVIAIAGAIAPAAAIAEVERAFMTWRASPSRDQRPTAARRPPARPAPIDPTRKPYVHIPLAKVQGSLAVGLPGVARDSDDFVALSALNYLLGETGYAGRLGEVLVDTGIAYSVYASVLADRSAGPIFITTDAVRSRDAADRILQTLEAFARKGVSAAELREAQGFLLGRLLFRFESPQAATDTLAEIGYFHASAPSQRATGTEPLREFAGQVLALNADDVNRVAARYYDPSRAVVVIAGAERVELGQIQVLAIRACAMNRMKWPTSALSRSRSGLGRRRTAAGPDPLRKIGQSHAYHVRRGPNDARW
jgi:zinc protease